MKKFFSTIYQSPSKYLFLCFFLISLLFREDGATNERSRYATMRAMSKDFSFQIDNYKDWTVDWAQTPSGHYYSNKAPGPMFIALPIFFLLDLFNTKASNLKVGPTTRVLISIFHQILPFLFVIGLLGITIKSLSINSYPLLLMSSTLLFAHTASLFMNIYLGHGIAAIFFLLFFNAYLKKSYKQIGLWFGLALLSDYSVAFTLPAFVYLIISNKTKFSQLKSILIGSLTPLTLWLWYHIVCFGGPFNLPAKFQNPRFVDTPIPLEGQLNLWGVFSFNFNPTVYLELLFGMQRGILFTQPWVLLLVIFGLPLLFQKEKNKKTAKSIFIFCLISLSGLLFMNASFGGWHGGATSGPRYLSIIFPIFAIFMAFIYENLSKWQKYILHITIFFSLVFRALVYGSRVLAPENRNLWPYLWQDLLSKEGYKGEIRFLIFFVLLALAIYFSLKNNSKINNLKESSS